MKRLISAITVNEARKSGKHEIVIGGKSTIITDEARDLAKKYNIKFVESANIPATDTQKFDRDTIKLIVEKTLERLPSEKRDMGTVTDAVLKVLNNYKK
jgi:hypothetical protein